MDTAIFEISREPVAPAERIGKGYRPGKGNNPAGYSIDYCYEVDGKERERLTGLLADTILPKGMFARTDPDGLVYQGGYGEWLDGHFDRADTMAKTLFVSDCVPRDGRTLMEYLEDPLGAGCLFLPWGAGEELGKSGRLMDRVASLKPGDKLYIGGVIRCKLQAAIY